MSVPFQLPLAAASCSVWQLALSLVCWLTNVLLGITELSRHTAAALPNRGDLLYELSLCVVAGRQCGKVKGIRFKDAIRNARVVEQQKAPAHSGDWRGCRKSPW